MPSPKKKKKTTDDVSSNTDIDDIVFEETGQMEEKLTKLKEKLTRCLKENKENLDGWQRSRADFVNTKKENEQKIKEFSSYAKSEFISELFPVIDSFDMAFSNKEAWEKVDKNWRTGVEYIHSQLTSVLENNGLKEINPENEMFDPRFHTSTEIVMTSNKQNDGMVVEVVQKGYELNENVLRPAKVKVGQFKK